MEKIGEKFLPIGSVVMLKGGKKRVMVTGFCSVDEKDKEKVYDYAGCLYPEGMITSNQTLLFNHEQIEEVFHLGLSDDEEKQFKEKLNTVLKKYEESKK